MNRSPLVSIILPVYNVAAYLPQCLDSLLSQTCKELEIIAVDDGSTDESGRILEEYKKREPQKLSVYHLENHGVSYARNFGFLHSSGDYVWFVDSDDVLPESACQVLVRKAAEGGCDLVLFANTETDDAGKETLRPLLLGADFPSSFREDPKSLILISVYGWCRFLKRELAEKMPFPEGIRFEDLPFSVFTAAAASRVGLVFESCYTYRSQAGFLSRLSGETLDILKALDVLSERMKEEGLYRLYQDELEFLAVKHILLRFRQIAWNREPGKRELRIRIVKECFSYLSDQYPRWQENPLVKSSLPPFLKSRFALYSQEAKMLRFIRLTDGKPDVFARLLLKFYQR
ncbi:MAG: glycosyltransferase family 2 protein [Blautia sp.]|nr:glycosyltransferase family 2 protein [Blautia sp.]